MEQDSQSSGRLDEIRSVTLAELTAPRPEPRFQVPELRMPRFKFPRPELPELPLLGDVLKYARIALMAWGAVSFGAIVGFTFYYLNGSPETPLAGAAVEQSRTEQAPADRLALAIAEPESPPPPEISAAATSAATVLEVPPPIREAPLPRPRPDDPVITGSIGAPRYDPSYRPIRRRELEDPCAALRRLGMQYLFGTRCAPEARFYAPRPDRRVYIAPPPPPPEYYPRPYQPPIIVEE